MSSSCFDKSVFITEQRLRILHTQEEITVDCLTQQYLENGLINCVNRVHQLLPTYTFVATPIKNIINERLAA